MNYNEAEHRKLDQWMDAVSSAAKRNCIDPDGIYYGREGAMRLGRECGAAIPDFDLDPQDAITSTYGGICVRAYWQHLCINNSEWLEAMWEGYNKAMKIRNENKLKEDINETQLQEA